ncbi:AAA family ATPase [Nostoc sp. FACHB-152]|uniref:AAA family ATPase n=1 Tax=unclassified Nostoc TaxID=2593658 RepID=UPI0016871283|nr:MULTISPECIES: AAA family ATPase [unclassified Nostoc]MBD2449909.1 AAA family ATPase [Nostoc sp. FACHB-152]MBD2471369.1 AAA family ATPase [Nostoc sp. FACHB-145]
MVSLRVTIPGYHITEELYNGSRTQVYRGYRQNDSLPVVVKLLKNPFPSFSELVQFRNQYTIAKNLNSPLIIQTYSLEPYQNGYVLVMEDFGGISLQEWVLARNLQSLTEFLPIAIALCNTLEILYREQIIHKDIKPSNILINPQTKQIKLIDFSIASLLPRETQTLISPNVLEGTLAYISPEQTGRMNRGIDYRTDFYSLGVTFYELLTGELPFQADDAMELIHSHIAKTPPAINSKNIPHVLSDIVMKLMAKNAEDRYQSVLGLKFDLEHCWHQLKETNKINSFEIAQRDLCDRFIIPDKLYGREAAVDTLLQAFARVSLGATEMMLVAGFSGIGKTAVINEVHKPIVKQRGYFIKGKFDQFNRNIPLLAFVQAFRDLMGQLLTESDTQIQQWKNKILNAVGDSGQVIIDVVPELERIIGKQPLVPELSGTAAENRFNLIFHKFTAVFTSKSHPLVIFLDDLQWADSASLKLIQLLMADTEHLLLIGAYRDHEVTPIHPLILTLGEIEKTQATINTITLAPLSQGQINQLVADTLKCTTKLALPLGLLIFQKTQGNPFFVTQFLKALHQDKLIKFNFELGGWECDITQVTQQAVTDEVVDFMAFQLRRLPFSTQNILQLAACIGSEFDLATLAIVSQASEIETATNLWKALQEGLILPISDIYKFYQGNTNDRLVGKNDHNNQQLAKYRFLHDRVQQAAYSLIPDRQKQKTHYQIGQLLLKQISPAARVDRIFELVNQLNHGTSLITQQTEREQLAQLNLTACRKAKAATAYQAAREYITVGISLLGETAWQQQYDMTLALHELAAELAMLCGDFETMEQFINIVIQQAHSLPEQVKVHCIKIQSYISQYKFTEAIAIAQSILQQLGVTFPETPTPTDIQQVFQELAQLIGKREIEDLVNLPVMTDEVKLAIVQIASSIISAAHLTGSPLLPLLVALSVKLSIQHGNTSVSAFNYAMYGIMLCNMLKDVDKAVKFGQLALQLVYKLDAKETKSEVLAVLEAFLLHRNSHIKDTLLLSHEGYATGLEVGNIEFAGNNAINFCLNSLWCGQPLVTLEQEISTYCHELLQLHQLTTANRCHIFWQFVLNLLDLSENPTILSGEAVQETEFLPMLLSTNDLFGVYWFYLSKLTLCFWLGEIEQATNYAVEVRRYAIAGAGFVGEPAFYFYDSLIVLSQLSSIPDEKSETFRRIAENQTQLQHWAYYAPMNHQHKVDLVEAEKYRVLGLLYEAADYYDRAIFGAKANGYIQEEAIANELAAKFYLNWGKDKVAAGYMQEAYYCYARWGAKAKTNDLENRYPQLLQLILQQQKLNFNPLETIAFHPVVSSNRTSISDSTSYSNVLDFASIFKATQAISSSLKLDELIASLLQIILENSGAKKAVLLLQDSTWQVRATALIKDGEIETILETQLLETCQDIPVKLIHYVRNTQQTVVIDNGKTDIPGVIGQYMLIHQPQSVLCTPIVNQGHLVGMLYLENKLTSGVFTSDRLSILNFFCTQAAISLENAQLYNHLQEREKFLTSIYAGIGCSIFVADVRDNGRFEYTGWSKSSELASGISLAEALGKTPQELLGVNEGEKVYQKYLHCCHNGIPLTYEECLQLHGQETWWLTTLSPLKDEAGKVYRLVGTTINISDRRQAEKAVTEKSQALATALEDLKNTQLQMVQNEKMSALGNLVAGVAHEMNNPLGFISASLKQTQPTIADIVEHLKLYQESLPNPSDEIKDHAEEIDLDYSLEDLPKVIDSMIIACDRLKNISTSLRTFSRADQDYKVLFNIHEGIDSTILILKHRLKANDQRPAIEVITEYGNLPQIECFPGQLNQVFMNILANAIDALDELSLKVNRVLKLQIFLQTSVQDKSVAIKIADNGVGMDEEVKQKIFDHLFTTKTVGKGTGLGLAIARQIIVEKHGGYIQCNSSPGQGTEFVILIPIK